MVVPRDDFKFGLLYGILHLLTYVIYFFFFLMIRRPPRSPLFPPTTLFRSNCRTACRRPPCRDGARLLRVAGSAPRRKATPTARVPATAIRGPLPGLTRKPTWRRPHPRCCARAHCLTTPRNARQCSFAYATESSEHPCGAQLPPVETAHRRPARPRPGTPDPRTSAPGRTP